MLESCHQAKELGRDLQPFFSRPKVSLRLSPVSKARKNSPRGSFSEFLSLTIKPLPLGVQAMVPHVSLISATLRSGGAEWGDQIH